MSVKVSTFINGKGREVKYIEISGDKYPTKIGMKKARKVLDNDKEVRFLLDQLGVK